MTNGAGPSARTILKATAAAAAAAAVILVVVVLPAEYGIDPLGTGKRLGLTALAEAGGDGAGAAAAPQAVRSGVNTAQTPDLRDDQFRVELRPFEGVEYKYRMEKGATMVYAWRASAKVKYEFHGEPDGAPAKYFESYDKSENVEGRGMFIAPTTGIHGWYWKNPGVGRVTITLTSTGFYGTATEFRDGEKILHEPTKR